MRINRKRTVAAKQSCFLFRLIRRGIVHNNNLQISIIAFQNGIQDDSKTLASIVGRYDNRYHFIHSSCPRVNKILSAPFGSARSSPPLHMKRKCMEKAKDHKPHRTVQLCVLKILLEKFDYFLFAPPY